MTMERMPESPPVVGVAPTEPDAAARALRAQLLATEHWSLLASRSLSWNESFARASMFLTMLSGATVALALVAQATHFGSEFGVFALLLLPVVLFMGIATFVRLVDVNNEDLRWVVGINRLRSAYLDLDPGLAEYFITGWTEDVDGLMRSFGARSSKYGALHGLVTTPAAIGLVSCTLAGVTSAILVVQLGAPMVPAAATGAVAFVVTFAALARLQYLSLAATGLGFFGADPLQSGSPPPG